MTDEEPECHCTERIDAPGADWDGMEIHASDCAWVSWMIGFGRDE